MTKKIENEIRCPENIQGSKSPENYGAGIRKLIDDVVALALIVYGKTKRYEWFRQMQKKYDDEISKKYKDYKNYKAYHIFIGSSHECEKLDFPEPDSVKTYLENLLEELNERLEGKKKP